MAVYSDAQTTCKGDEMFKALILGGCVLLSGCYSYYPPGRMVSGEVITVYPRPNVVITPRMDYVPYGQRNYITRYHGYQRPYQYRYYR